MEIIFYQIYQ